MDVSEVTHDDLNLTLTTIQLQALIEQYERVCDDIDAIARPLYRKRDKLINAIARLITGDTVASINGYVIKPRKPFTRKRCVSQSFMQKIRASRKRLEVKKK